MMNVDSPLYAVTSGKKASNEKYTQPNELIQHSNEVKINTDPVYAPITGKNYTKQMEIITCSYIHVHLQPNNIQESPRRALIQHMHTVQQRTVVTQIKNM